MKKILGISIVVAVSSFLNAHDFWVDSNNEANLKAHIGYGHGFPEPEKISENRLSIFSPLTLKNNKKEEIVLSNKGENYQYISKEELKKGSYILSGLYKETFWSKTKDNKWKMGQTKLDLKENAAFCEIAKMEAKSIVLLDKTFDKSITEPIGQTLEVVPLDNPADYTVNKTFKIKVLFKGKPLKTTEVKATVAGFPEGQYAFVGTTDLKGEIKVTALKEGKWLLKVSNKVPYPDLKKCDEEYYSSTYTFNVNK